LDQPAAPNPADERFAELQRKLELVPSKDLRYHVVKVSTEGTTTLVFDSLSAFLENAKNLLVAESGTPTRLLFYYGWRMEFTTPQILVGLTLPGAAKASPMVLTKSGSNPTGDVPDRALSSES
jgi:hypothetical protein